VIFLNHINGFEHVEMKHLVLFGYSVTLFVRKIICAWSKNSCFFVRQHKTWQQCSAQQAIFSVTESWNP